MYTQVITKVIEVFATPIAVIISQYIFILNNHIADLKCTQCVICQLYLTKAEKKRFEFSS